MVLKYNRNIYSKISLLKAAYHFTENAYVHIDMDDSSYIVELSPKDGMELSFHPRDFDNEMLAQTLRYEILQATKDIRTITLARALGSSVLEDDQEDKDRSNEINTEMSDILKDWFQA